MGKYTPLKQHLMSLSGSEWRANFAEIENILGSPLPKSAFEYQAWWSNSAGSHIQTSAWIEVGWKTASLNLASRSVTFVKVSSGVERGEAGMAAENKERPTKRLTIDEAKAGLARQFSVPIESIEIIIKG